MMTLTKTRSDVSSQSQCGYHLLIVEDEPHIARLLEHVLRREGYSVAVARDAEKALESMTERTPDGLIVDIGLPTMSGLDFLRLIGAQGRWVDLVVIILSGHWLAPNDRMLTSLGAVAQFPKPIAPSKLLRKLRECGMTPLGNVPASISERGRP